MATKKPRPEPADPLAEFPIPPLNYFMHLSMVISGVWNATAERALAGYDFDMAGFRAMRVVNHYGSATMGELADYTFSDRTTLTRVVDHLVDIGFMERSKPPGDRRKVVLTLTDEGRRQFVKSRRDVVRTIDDLASEVPDDEFRAAVRLQMRVIDRLAESPLRKERLLWRGGVNER